MTSSNVCPFGLTDHTRGKAHRHQYTMGEFGARQCSCGSRRWVVSVVPALPTTIVCERCGKQNYSATAYERGREAGPRVREAADAPAPF